MPWSHPLHRLALPVTLLLAAPAAAQQIGQELSIPQHLADGQEHVISLADLVKHGRDMFAANWTIQEGGGRPLTKGTGGPLADMTDPLDFPRNFNRVSAPDANSCAGCHNLPFGIPGGGGDFVANVFVLGHRFDFVTFNDRDALPTKAAIDEKGKEVSLQSIANSRNTLGMFGSGFIEMLARQITSDLQALRDTCAPGANVLLVSKGISFGSLSRDLAGNWVTTRVNGLAPPSLATTGPANPPNLIVRPFHQAGAVISLRQFSNNALNHHHGIQSTERFGTGADPDGDGFVDEASRADVTAMSVFQAVMAVPGRVIPSIPAVEAAIALGENKFVQANCVRCHIPSLPLDNSGWLYSEPNPFNPSGNLQPGPGVTPLVVDLSDPTLPTPRLAPQAGVVHVPAFTDLKLHDITSGPLDPNREPIDMQFPLGSNDFFKGNSRFLTRKLWGTANEPPYFHHGQYSTLREAVEAHAGEAAVEKAAWTAFSAAEKDAVIEFLKSLQVLPPGTTSLVIDQNGAPRAWPAFPAPLLGP